MNDPAARAYSRAVALEMPCDDCHVTTCKIRKAGVHLTLNA